MTDPAAGVTGDAESAMAYSNRMSGFWRALFVVGALGLGGFSLWSAGPGIAEDQVLLGVYTATTWVLLLLGRPARDGADWASPGLVVTIVAIVFSGVALQSLMAFDRVFEQGAGATDYAGWGVLVLLGGIALRLPRALDLILAGVTLCVFSYYMIEYLPLVDRAGAWTHTDTGMSVVAVAIAIEVARRGIGLWIPGIAIAMLCYAHFGNVFPEAIAHRGIDFPRIFNYALYSQEGIFGVMTTVMANTVLIFILLGAFMNQSGMGRFFIDFPLAIAGRSAGGPAKVAVFASAIFGSISGSSLANIVSTGTFTIPLMRKVGFSRNVAGAVENTASLGGQLLPPVMGAGVFVMAEITGVPYTEIIAVAAIPALLYMASIVMIVHFQAKREGIASLTADEVPVLRTVLRDGWFHLLPFAILLGFLIRGYSPDWCAVMAIVSIVVINWTRVIWARLSGIAPPDEILGVRGIVAALRKGVENSLAIGAAAACVGIIVGMFALTGLGLKISVLFVDFSQGSLLIALLLIAVTSLIMGMALPITASYLVLAILAGPALETFGLPLVAAHLIIFWLSQDSNITPPVCLGAFVAASIAGGDPWKTGWLSFRFAKMLYIMPLLFAFTPILFTGPLVWTLWTIFSACVGTIAFSAWTIAYFRAPVRNLTWLLLGSAAVLCFMPYDTDLIGAVPGYILNCGGIALLIGLYIFQRPDRSPASASPQSTDP